MKSEDENTELTLIESNEFTNAVSKFASMDLKKGLKSAKVVMPITKEYLSLEEGKPKRFVFCGVCKFEKVDKSTAEITTANAVTLMDENKKLFIAAQVALVQSMIDLPVGSAVEIVQLASKNLSGGKKLAQFEINLLG